MIIADAEGQYDKRTIAVPPQKSRYPARSKNIEILSDIYQEQINIAIWQRKLSEPLQRSVQDFLLANSSFQTAITVSPKSALSSVCKAFGTTGQFQLSQDIAELVDMFCCLFDLKRAGLRLAILSRAMCPRFHVDKVPCRLVTTYQGVGSEWLPHQVVNRKKIGAGSGGKPDVESGLFDNPNDIFRLDCGDVGLLKGELWEGNENSGLVHRSPDLTAEGKRLLLTLDFSN